MTDNGKKEAPKQKIEFLDMFRFFKNGKPQDPSVVMSFSYALLFLAVYLIMYGLLIGPLHDLFAGYSLTASAIAEAAVPAAAGAVICSLPLLFVRERRYVLLGYIWLACASILFYLAMLFALRGEKDAQKLFSQTFLMTAVPSVLFGAAAAVLLYRRMERIKPREEDTSGDLGSGQDG